MAARAQFRPSETTALVIYQTADRSGSTFSLSREAERALRAEFGGSLRLAPRVFIAHETQDDYERLHGDIGRQIVVLLTGLAPEQVAKFGPVEFRDPVTERPLGLLPPL